MKKKKKSSATAKARNPTDEGVRLLSALEVAERTGLTTVTLWKWAHSGKFPPARKVGTRNIAWLSSDVDEWIHNLPMQLKGRENEN